MRSTRSGSISFTVPPANSNMQVRDRHNRRAGHHFAGSLGSDRNALPQHRFIRPLPEFVRPQQDPAAQCPGLPGEQRKQDCEINAAQRWLHARINALRPYRPVFPADDLCCSWPNRQRVVDLAADLLFVCLIAWNETRLNRDTVFHMKITLDIDDSVMQRLQEEAARRKITMSLLVEAALRRVLDDYATYDSLSYETLSLPTWNGGKELVDISDRHSLYKVMEEG